MEYIGNGFIKLEVTRGPKTATALINTNMILQAYSDPKGNTLIELAGTHADDPVKVYVPLDIDAFTGQLRKILP